LAAAERRACWSDLSRAAARSFAASSAASASTPTSTARAIVRPASSIRTSFFSPTNAIPLTTSIR
jgi:hypothetical protein